MLHMLNLLIHDNITYVYVICYIKQYDIHTKSCQTKDNIVL